MNSFHKPTAYPSPAQQALRSGDLRTRRAENTLCNCKAPGCDRTRVGLGHYCGLHGRRAKLYGDPTAAPLSVRDFQKEREEVRQLLADNADHPGIAAGLDFIRQWMRQAVELTAQMARLSPGGRYRAGLPVGTLEVSRVARHGVNAEEVLAAVAAAFAYEQRHPHALPSDRAWMFQTARAFASLAPRPRYAVGRAQPDGRQQTVARPAKAYDLAAIGQTLRTELGALLVNIAGSLKSDRQRHQERTKAMQAPLA